MLAQASGKGQPQRPSPPASAGGLGSVSAAIRGWDRGFSLRRPPLSAATPFAPFEVFRARSDTLDRRDADASRVSAPLTLTLSPEYESVARIGFRLTTPQPVGRVSELHTTGCGLHWPSGIRATLSYRGEGTGAAVAPPARDGLRRGVPLRAAPHATTPPALPQPAQAGFAFLAPGFSLRRSPPPRPRRSPRPRRRPPAPADAAGTAALRRATKKEGIPIDPLLTRTNVVPALRRYLYRGSTTNLSAVRSWSAISTVAKVGTHTTSSPSSAR